MDLVHVPWRHAKLAPIFGERADLLDRNAASPRGAPPLPGRFCNGGARHPRARHPRGQSQRARHPRARHPRGQSQRATTQAQAKSDNDNKGKS